MATTTPANASTGYKTQIGVIAAEQLYPRSADEITAGVTPTDYSYPVGNVLRYGADPTSSAVDSTAAFQAAVDVVYAQGGGDVIIPTGFYGVDTIVKVWDKISPVNIRGTGRAGTVADEFGCTLEKYGAGTDPVINFSSSGSTWGGNNVFSDFMIIGNANTHDGIRLTDWSRFTMERITVTGCDTAFNNRGSQQFSAIDLTLNTNVTGYKNEVGVLVNPTNMCTFFGGSINSNTNLAVDLTQSSNCLFQGVTFEQNGTVGVSTSGGVIIRAGISGSNPYSFTEFKNCWFEGCKVIGLRAEATVSTTLRLNGCHFYDALDNGGNQVEIEGISVLEVNHCHFFGTGAALTTEADNTIINGKLGLAGIVYTDNSTNGPNTTDITRNINTNHIKAESVSASDSISDTGQVGTFAFISASAGNANIGAYNYDAAKTEKMTLFCSHVMLPSYTSTELLDKDDFVNTDNGKVKGAMVLDSTLGIAVFAAGNLSTDDWMVSGSNETTGDFELKIVHTPV